MEALKTKTTATNGVVQINVPKQFEGQELEVIVLSANERNETGVNSITLKQEKINRLLNIVGTAKDMNKTFDKTDVYDQ